MKNKTIIVYLTGRPGVGKYTVAKALAKNYNFIVCDNQLINNPILELLQYNGYDDIPDFGWDAIGRIRGIVLQFLVQVPENNYVLTNNLYENEGDKGLFEQVKQMAALRNSFFVPVRLLVSKTEHAKRITQPERKSRWKTIDTKSVYDEIPLLSIIHPYFLELDVTDVTPLQAAEKIVNHIRKIQSS